MSEKITKESLSKVLNAFSDAIKKEYDKYEPITNYAKYLLNESDVDYTEEQLSELTGVLVNAILPELETKSSSELALRWKGVY
jgi:hypothetical protein